MSRKDQFVTFLQSRWWIPFALVAALFLVAHIFIFRDVLAQIPAILAGDAVLAREELVPFFHAGQYWPGDTSALTGSDEIRVAYSFWSSWVRHYAVLPFALVLLNTASALILFYAFYRVGKVLYKDRRLMIIFVAFLAAVLMHFVMLYAKITHFYTLILGFSMMSLALSYMFEQLFFRQELSRRNVVIACLLTLFNPAVHYHVIIYMVLVLAIGVHLLMTAIWQKQRLKAQAIKDGWYFLWVILLSLVPYAVFILLTTSAMAATESIPVNYHMIITTSVPIGALLAFDIAAQVDMFRYGTYLVPIPRATMMVVSVLILSLFFFKRWRQQVVQHKIFMVSMFILLVISAWMSLGYSAAVSFHALLAPIVVGLARYTDVLANIVSQGIGLFINILRFPHRFEFVYFYVGGILLMVALLWIIDKLRQKRFKKQSVWPFIIAALLVVSPLMLTRDYRPVLGAGDFGKFLRPYPISDDLKVIKKKLAKSDEDKLFILPTMESGRELPESKGEKGRYNFIDKFFIYYLDQPTAYYGLGATPEQKIKAFLIYRAIHEGEPWWQDVLIDTMGITHILYPKDAKPRPIGLTYMPEVDEKIGRALASSDRFEAVHNGNEYALYRAKPRAEKAKPTTMVNMDWQNLRRYFTERPRHEELLFPIQLSDDKLPEKFTVQTDSVERSFYDLYFAARSEQAFTPDFYIAPFVKDVTPSSYFTTQTLSIFTLDDARDRYNLAHEKVPTLTGLTDSQFVVTDEKGGLVRIGFMSKGGEQRLLLRAASHQDSLKVMIDDKPITFKKLKDDQTKKPKDHLDFTYFAANVKIGEGVHTAIVDAVKDTVVIESMNVLPHGEVPEKFGKVDMENLKIKPTDKDSAYDVVLQREEDQ